MKFGPVAPEEAEGATLAHGVRVGGQMWRKAHAISAEDVAAMRAAGVSQVVVARLDPEDVHEDEAATLLAAALEAAGLDARPAATGRVNIHASAAGVFRADRAVVDAINRVDPAITLATLADLAPVQAGDMVATVKIIPFAVPVRLLDRAIAAASGAISMHPYRARRVAMVQTMLPSLKASVADKTRRITEARLARSGSTIVVEERCAHEAATLAEHLESLGRGSDLLLVFGASAVSDADDVIPAAIRQAGGKVERVGMPVDPGNLLVVGEIAGVPVIGAPGCARSPKPNGFDWVLDRLMADIAVTEADIAGMGVGGLLMEIPSRPQPRDASTSTTRPVGVHGVLLAAGRSRRMGGPNKLVAELDGKALVRRVAEALVGAGLDGITVVTGHEVHRVRAALDGLDLGFVDNPYFATGLASSLRAGIAAVPEDAAGALVALGDMPLVTAGDIGRLVAAFREGGGTAIARATHAGKRGNPVILPRALFPAVMALQGDTGARQIVEEADVPVVDVEIGEAASLDLDTRDALALAGGRIAAGEVE